ncbi:hypothetical protein AC578_8175 [Pseudocercospora eumusae]|uniref:Uncharacterized protein n=1 Tax=Pseudocercospora eumusae TaxID=321146 RepID=A0A139HF14_9PEZI|nr:hypothetical protein AC578_8175 [Pseudocercospora eumusae]
MRTGRPCVKLRTTSSPRKISPRDHSQKLVGRLHNFFLQRRGIHATLAIFAKLDLLLLLSRDRLIQNSRLGFSRM